jgi:phage terminase large subunit
MKPVIQPNRKQHEAWLKLKDKTTEYIVYGGAAGGGKSWLGCEWLLTQCFFYPGTRYFIGRAELKDIRESTLISFYKVLRHHGIKFDSIGKYNGQDHFIGFNNGSRIDLVEMNHRPSDPLYERFGSMEFTAGWIEEAGEVDELAAEIISSRTGRMYNDKYNLLGKTLITCNPKKNFLYYKFYQPFKQGNLDTSKCFIQAFVDDNEFGEKGYKAKLEGLTGAARQRLLIGDWEYDDDPAALIQYEKILDTFTNDFDALRGNAFITCDVARFGSDKTVIGLWDGFRVRMCSYSGLSVSETADKIRDLQRLHSIPNSRTIADEDGVGGGVVDILKCKGFVNNSRPLMNPVTREDENYNNLKSQCYYKLAERINRGGLYIECTDTKMKADIVQELEQVKQHNMDKDGKKMVLPKDKVKEQIGRSPDYSDTLMMREWFELSPKLTWIAF